MTLETLAAIVPAITALLAALTGLVVAIRGQKALATKQDSIIAASAARDVKLNEVHAATVTETTQPEAKQ